MASNVALATLGRDLHSTVADIQWVVTGYMLALAAVIPVTGWAARRFGAKRVYLISLALFTAGSVLCGLASSTEELIVFRVLQGFGGGMILPIGQHGTAFWFAGGLTALAIVPCIILMRAERAARAAKGDEGTPPDVMAEAVAA